MGRTGARCEVEVKGDDDMRKPVRRVVTGHNAQGQSIVVSDGPAPFVHVKPNDPDWYSTDVFRTLSWRVTIGITIGLVAGKVLGILFASWLAVRSRRAALPTGVDWKHVFGASWLGGIGFTMSLFVAALAFGSGPLLDSAKVGILAGSLVAGVTGAVLLRFR